MGWSGKWAVGQTCGQMGSLAGSNQFAKARKNSRSVITNFNFCQSYEWPTSCLGVSKKKKASVKIMLNPLDKVCRQNFSNLY